MAAKENSFTNRSEVFNDDTKNWTYVPDAKLPVGGDPNAPNESPVYAPGAGGTGTSPEGGVDFGKPPMPNQPELGMAPQNKWDVETAKKNLPGMFQTPTDTWLDPAEEAKKREGLPYDPTKRYDETKPYPGINVPSLTSPDQHPPGMKMDRARFEQNLFKVIGGNPALFQPYNEVVKAGAYMPQLFEQTFPGKTWGDLTKLNPTERAHWEQETARFNRHVLDQAKAKKNQMDESYKQAMGMFAYNEKEAEAELAKQEKEKLRVLAREKAANPNKAPDHVEGFNPELGVKTLRLWDAQLKMYVEAKDPYGKPIPTSEVKPEHLEPQRIKALRAEIKRMQPSKTDAFQMFIMAMSKDEGKRVSADLDRGMTPETKQRIAGYENEINNFMDGKGEWAGYWARNGARAPGSGVGSSGAAAPAAQPVVNTEEAISEIVAAELRNPTSPKVRASIEKFNTDYPSKSKRLQEVRARAGLIKGASAVSATAPEVSSAAAVAAPAAVASKKNTESELPPTYGPIDFGKDVVGLDWTSPAALAKDLYGKAAPPSDTALSDERARDVANFMKKGGS